MISVEAPAKTNLFLEVPWKREDGFHELDTVFVALALSDTLEVSPRDDGQLRLELEGAGPDVSAGPDNLVWRAADGLRRLAGQAGLGADLRLVKRIPSGGGLGGGSSDAAAALRALREAWRLELTPSALHGLAAELGSDVPFFLQGGLQRGRGRGEQLERLPACPPLHLVLLLPDFGCPTPQVYRALAPFLPSEARSAEPMLAALASGDPGRVARELFNRLEQPALAEFPVLATLKAELAGQPGVLGALLSGSGSTLVALAAGPREAAVLAERLSTAGYRAIPTRSA